jgi:hypothetical protein
MAESNLLNIPDIVNAICRMNTSADYRKGWSAAKLFLIQLLRHAEGINYKREVVCKPPTYDLFIEELPFRKIPRISEYLDLLASEGVLRYVYLRNKKSKSSKKGNVVVFVSLSRIEDLSDMKLNIAAAEGEFEEEEEEMLEDLDVQEEEDSTEELELIDRLIDSYGRKV